MRSGIYIEIKLCSCSCKNVTIALIYFIDNQAFSFRPSGTILNPSDGFIAGTMSELCYGELCHL